MRRIRVFVSLSLTLLLFCFLGIAGAQVQQQYPPVWTDIVNMTGQTNMASGNYYQIGSGNAPVLNTDIASLTPVANTLSMPVSTLPGCGAFDACGYVAQPVSFLESNQGSGITGVGFLGSFNSPGSGLLFAPYNQSPYNITFQPNSNLFESVFFNEGLCYSGSEREYGFFLAASNNSVWAYWGTNEGLPCSVVQGQMQLSAANNTQNNGVTIQPNTEYYFEMYPVVPQGGATCTFQIAVYTANNTVTPVFTASPSVTSNGAATILSVDPGFPSAIASDTGYVSCNIEAVPYGAVTGNLPSTSVLNLNMQRVFVGKI